MKMKTIEIDNVFLTVPLRYNPPAIVLDCCGAGDGLGQKIVPDTIYGLRVSPV